jgi:hypothetical protein
MLSLRNLQERHSALCAKVKDSAEFFRSRFETPPMPRAHVELTSAIERKDWEQVDKIIEQTLRRDYSGAFLHELFSQPLPENGLSSTISGLPLVLAMVVQDSSPKLFEKLHELGVPINQRAPDSWQIPGATAIHLAVAEKRFHLIPKLASCGVNPNALAGDGETSPLQLAVQAASSREGSIEGLPELVSSGASLRTLADGTGLNLRGCRISEDLRGFSLRDANLIGANLSQSRVDRNTLKGCWYGPDTVLPESVIPSSMSMRPGLMVPDLRTGSPRYYSKSELEKMFEESGSKRPKYLADEARRLVKVSGKIRDGVLYLQVAEENAKFGNQGTGAAMTELLPRLIYGYEPGVIGKLLGSIEASMEGLKPAADYHPNEAEFLALLRHSRDTQLERIGAAGQLTRVLTSITYWYGSNEKLEMNTEVASNWGRIGALNFSFGRFKHDAMREYQTLNADFRIAVGPCLLEQFGGKPYDLGEVNTYHKPDGSLIEIPLRGFAFPAGWKEFNYIGSDKEGNSQRLSADSQLSIVLSQTDIKISHPIHGSLVIPNKSPLFARGYYEGAAYFSELGVGDGMSQEELLSITPKNLGAFGFREILNIDLNASVPDLQKNIGALLDRFDAFYQDYSRWKFDTNRYTALSYIPIPGQEEMRLLGGPASPGFRSLIDIVERLSKKGLPVALAFVPHDLPPVVPYSFSDEEGKQRQLLSINAERLSALKELARGPINVDRLKKNGIFQFIDTGFRNEADLIIVESHPSWIQ